MIKETRILKRSNLSAQEKLVLSRYRGKSLQAVIQGTRGATGQKSVSLLPSPQPGKQSEFYYNDVDVLIYGGSAGSGKAERAGFMGKAIRGGKLSMEDALAGKSMLSCDKSSCHGEEVKESFVLDWKGHWKGFSEITVGDKIMNPDGSHQEVLQVHERGFQQFYLVSFEDGTSVECCGDHLWSFWEARTNSRSKTCNGENPVESNLTPREWNKNYITRARVRDTKWLIAEVAKGRRFIVPVNAPLQFTGINRSSAERAYVYGCLIGDGSYSVLPRDGGSIFVTTVDQFIVDKLMSILGPSCYVSWIDGAKDGYQKKARVVMNKIAWVKAWLRNNDYFGKRSWEKCFPVGYLSADLEFRYALAQGLFDTDGTVGFEKREVSYCTTSKALAEQVVNLVRSLGYMAKISTKNPTFTHNGESRQGRMAYNVMVEGNHLELLFSLPRKVERAKALGQFNAGASWPGKRIVSIEPTDVDYARCITVSNPNHLYVTDGYNVTHNSFCMLLDFAKPEYINNPGYNAVIFRKSYPELTNPGGLVDESRKLYPLAGGVYVSKPPTWRFKSGSQIVFRHIRHEDTKYEYQGSQFARVGFDELTHFSESIFMYLLSRNRSACGVRPQVRATCNPDADSWVAKFIAWYWDARTGYAIPERSGKIRYFLRMGDEVFWADDPDSLIRDHLDTLKPIVENSQGMITYRDLIKSFTFISASVYDNPALLKANPQYLANLNALHQVEKERLLFGNWKIRFEAGIVFSASWFKVITHRDLPVAFGLVKHLVRFWDLAATDKSEAGRDSCFTAGCLMAQIGVNFYIFNYQIFQKRSGEVINHIKGTAASDGVPVAIRWEQEGGSSGKIVEEDFTDELLDQNPNYDCAGIMPKGSKFQRALPVATQAQLGHVYLVSSCESDEDEVDEWIQRFLNAVQSFDGTFKPEVNDIVDALSGAYEYLRTHQDHFDEEHGLRVIPGNKQSKAPDGTTARRVINPGASRYI